MIKKEFRDTGIMLSALGMGLMRLPTIEGTPQGTIDEKEAEEIVRYAYEHGVNYFDTAFRYMGGASEPFAGKVLSQFPRDSYYLASKLPGHMMHFKDGKLGFHGYLSDFRCDTLSDIFEDQLRRCQTDYFDFYLLHNVNASSVDFYLSEEVGAVPYLLEEKKKGRIRHLGFSAHGSAEMIDDFLTHYEGAFEFVQIQLNYLDEYLQHAVEKYDVITKHGLPVWIMEGARGGSLIDLPDKAQAILKAVHPEDSMAKWAFRYLQSMPNVQVVLSGMTHLPQIMENVEIFSRSEPLTEEEREALRKVVDELLTLVPCTGCRYCTEECPQGLDIPRIITAYNELNNNGKPVDFLLNSEKESDMPSRCIGCGACASICPQGIKIPEIMASFGK